MSNIILFLKKERLLGRDGFPVAFKPDEGVSSDVISLWDSFTTEITGMDLNELADKLSSQLEIKSNSEAESKELQEEIKGLNRRINVIIEHQKAKKTNIPQNVLFGQMEDEKNEAKENRISLISRKNICDERIKEAKEQIESLAKSLSVIQNGVDNFYIKYKLESMTRDSLKQLLSHRGLLSYNKMVYLFGEWLLENGFSLADNVCLNDEEDYREAWINNREKYLD